MILIFLHLKQNVRQRACIVCWSLCGAKLRFLFFITKLQSLRMKKLSNSYDTAKKFVQKATFSSTFCNFYLLIIVNKEKKILPLQINILYTINL